MKTILLLFKIIMVSYCQTLLVAQVLTPEKSTYLPDTNIKSIRNHTNFDIIHVSGSMNVLISQGPYKVEVKGKNPEQIISEVTGSTLKIYPDKAIADKGIDKDIQIFITAPDFKGIIGNGSLDIKALTAIRVKSLELKINGSGNLTIESLNATKLEAGVNGSGEIKTAGFDLDELNANINGSGDIELAGNAKTGNLSVNGSGDIKAVNVNAEVANVNLSGSGDITLSVQQKITGNLRGSGDIRYKGNPAVNELRKNGSGNITKWN